MENREITQYYEFIKHVLEKLELLKHLPTLQLTSIAKAIECYSKDRRRIIFRPKPRADFEDIYPFGLTLTQGLSVKFPGNDQPKTIYEHFLYYPVSEGEDNKVSIAPDTRFSIAHELGHIHMHFPLHEHDNDRKYYPLSAGNYTVYGVHYDEDEEAQADAFAMVLCEQRKKRDTATFDEPCIRYLHKLNNDGMLRSKIKDMLPIPGCCLPEKKMDIVEA